MNWLSRIVQRRIDNEILRLLNSILTQEHQLALTINDIKSRIAILMDKVAAEHDETTAIVTYVQGLRVTLKDVQDQLAVIIANQPQNEDLQSLGDNLDAVVTSLDADLVAEKALLNTDAEPFEPASKSDDTKPATFSSTGKPVKSPDTTTPATASYNDDAKLGSYTDDAKAGVDNTKTKSDKASTAFDYKTDNKASTAYDNKTDGKASTASDYDYQTDDKTDPTVG